MMGQFQMRRAQAGAADARLTHAAQAHAGTLHLPGVRLEMEKHFNIVDGEKPKWTWD
jgi:hypothetical protein